MAKTKNIYDADFEDFKGWLKVDRGLLTLIPKLSAKNPRRTPLEAALILLNVVNQKGGKSYNGIKLKDGQAIISMQTKATEWNWGRNTVRSFTDKLHEHGVLFKYMKGSKGKQFALFSLARDEEHETIHGAEHAKALKTNDLKGVCGHGSAREKEHGMKHSIILPKLTRKEEEEVYKGKFPNQEMSYSAIKFIELNISKEKLSKVAEKVNKSGLHFQILLSNFRTHFETLEGRFFKSDSENSQNALIAIFNTFLDEQIKINSKIENENLWAINSLTGKMKTIWLEKYPNRILTSDDKKYFAKILGLTNVIVKTQKKIDGFTNTKATESEKLEVWSKFVQNVPQWILDGNYGFKYIASNFPNLYRSAITPKTKESRLNQSKSSKKGKYDSVFDAEKIEQAQNDWIETAKQYQL